MLADVARTLDMLGLDVVLDVGALGNEPTRQAPPLASTQAHHQAQYVL